jgi:predicted hotdog family 3-hydroxylacyl-ACP dehydratase
MDTGKIGILELIPQRPPFLLVDTLVDFEPERSVTSFEVRPDGILVRDGRLSEAGLMENIAQSCAARIGYINKYQKNETVKLGIIGAVKDFKVNFLPEAGSTLMTTIETISEVFGITLVSAVTTCGGEVAASCQMKISLTDIEQKG